MSKSRAQAVASAKSEAFTSEVTLIVNASESTQDREAIRLLRRHYNGELSILHRKRVEDEVLPSLWATAVCYRGLSRIEYFVEVLERTKGQGRTI